MRAPRRTTRTTTIQVDAPATPREPVRPGQPSPARRAAAVSLDARAAIEIEASLRTRLEALQMALRNGAVTRRESAVRATEEGAQAQETLESEVQMAVLHQRSQQIVQIEWALQRLAQGDYGRCRQCQEFIGLARLKALPFAQRCAVCQARQEREAAA